MRARDRRRASRRAQLAFEAVVLERQRRRARRRGHQRGVVGEPGVMHQHAEPAAAMVDLRGDHRAPGLWQHERPAVAVDVRARLGQPVGDGQRRGLRPRAHARPVGGQALEQAPHRRRAEHPRLVEPAQERRRQRGEGGEEHELRDALDRRIEARVLRGRRRDPRGEDRAARGEHGRVGAPFEPRGGAPAPRDQHQRGEHEQQPGDALEGEQRRGERRMLRHEQEVARAARARVVPKPRIGQGDRELRHDGDGVERRDDAASRAPHGPAAREGEQQVGEDGDGERVGECRDEVGQRVVGDAEAAEQHEPEGDQQRARPVVRAAQPGDRAGGHERPAHDDDEDRDGAAAGREAVDLRGDA
jgi:hypothetical protein